MNLLLDMVRAANYRITVLGSIQNYFNNTERDTCLGAIPTTGMPTTAIPTTGDMTTGQVTTGEFTTGKQTKQKIIIKKVL